MEMSSPFSSHTSPSSSSRPQLINRVRKIHFSQVVFGIFRTLMDSSIVGTQASIPWLAMIGGGKESVQERVEKRSNSRFFRCLIQPFSRDLSDRSPCIHPAHSGSSRISMLSRIVKFGTGGISMHSSGEGISGGDASCMNGFELQR